MGAVPGYGGWWRQRAAVQNKSGFIQNKTSLISFSCQGPCGESTFTFVVFDFSASVSYSGFAG